MKEFASRFFKRDYLSKHSVENLQVASLIRVVEKPSQSNFPESEEHIESLHQQFYRAGVSTFEYRYNPKGRNFFSELVSQLHAIEQLGDSRSDEALSYLRYLSTEDKEEVVEFEQFTIEKHWYPNAKGALRSFLNFNIQLTGTKSLSEMYSAETVEEENWDPELTYAIRNSYEAIQGQRDRAQNNPARQILNKAIVTLKQELQPVHI